MIYFFYCILSAPIYLESGGGGHLGLMFVVRYGGLLGYAAFTLGYHTYRGRRWPGVGQVGACIGGLCILMGIVFASVMTFIAMHLPFFSIIFYGSNLFFIVGLERLNVLEFRRDKF
jgi:hypothetical protein